VNARGHKVNPPALFVQIDAKTAQWVAIDRFPAATVVPTAALSLDFQAVAE